MLSLNTSELSKEWEISFYESAWDVDTLTLTDDERVLVEEMQSLLPRHMPVYDWNRPYAEAIILIIRRRAALPNAGRQP